MTSFLDALLLRPPAYVSDPKSLQRVYFTDSFPGFGEFTTSVTSYPVFRDLGAVRGFSQLGAFFATEVSLDRGAQARKARAALVTPSFLAMLRVKPRLGRLFLASEGNPGSSGEVAILSHELWRSAFAGSPDVIDRQLVVGNGVFTVIGVLPKGFRGIDLSPVDLWLPMTAATGIIGKDWAESRGSQFLEIAGRLQPGYLRKAAADEATAVFRAASSAAGRPKPGSRISLAPVQRARGPDAAPSVSVATWLTGLSWIVLLVACGNVAGLLLIRGLDRSSELTLRLALGASPSRLARLVLFDGAVIGGLGAVAAWLVFGVLTMLLERFFFPASGGQFGRLDPRDLVLVVGLSALAGLGSGLVPAFWASRLRQLGSLRGGGRQASARRSFVQTALAAMQLALTFALVVAALALVRSLNNVVALDLGMDAERVIVVTVDLEADGYSAARVDTFFKAAAARVEKLPGVESVSLAATIPFATSQAVSLSVPGVAELPQLATGGPYINAVSEDFFRTMGSRIVRGRSFTSHGTSSAPEAILNETMAALLWPNRPAIGRCVKIGGAEAPCSTVVGVVEDTRREALIEDQTMQFFVPLEQAPKHLVSRALFARISLPARDKVGAIRREIQALAPELPYVEGRPLSDLLQPQLRRWRLGARVLTAFGLLSLGLAALGLYGVVGHTMARRSFELGVRFALGASRRHVTWLALKQGLLIALAGSAGGAVIALLGAPRLQPLLFGVSASNPLILSAAATVIVAVAILASYVPSRRASRLDPGAVLRFD